MLPVHLGRWREAFLCYSFNKVDCIVWERFMSINPLGFPFSALQGGPIGLPQRGWDVGGCSSRLELGQSRQPTPCSP